MRTASRLLLGPQNELKETVKNKTEAFISLFQPDPSLEVEDELDDD